MKEEEKEKSIEIKVKDGKILFETKGFSDFEAIGVLSYYQEWLKLSKLQGSNPSDV